MASQAVQEATYLLFLSGGQVEFLRQDIFLRYEVQISDVSNGPVLLVTCFICPVAVCVFAYFRSQSCRTSNPKLVVLKLVWSTAGGIEKLRYVSECAAALLFVSFDTRCFCRLGRMLSLCDAGFDLVIQFILRSAGSIQKVVCTSSTSFYQDTCGSFCPMLTLLPIGLSLLPQVGNSLAENAKECTTIERELKSLQVTKL